MGQAGYVARMGDRRDAHTNLVGGPGGKRPLGASGHRWEDNIKMDIKEVRWGSMGWINLA